MSDEFLAVRDHFKAHAAFLGNNQDALTHDVRATNENVFMWLKDFFEKGSIFVADRSYGFFATDFKHSQDLTYSYQEEDNGIKRHALLAYDGRQGGHSMGLFITLYPPRDSGTFYRNALTIAHGNEEGGGYRGSEERFDVSPYSRDQAVAELFTRLVGEQQFWPFGLVFNSIKIYAVQAAVPVSP